MYQSYSYTATIPFYSIMPLAYKILGRHMQIPVIFVL